MMQESQKAIMYNIWSNFQRLYLLRRGLQNLLFCTIENYVNHSVKLGFEAAIYYNNDTLLRECIQELTIGFMMILN